MSDKNSTLFLLNPEVLAKVSVLYHLILGRAPDKNGLLHYSSLLSSGLLAIDIAKYLLNSNEFVSSIGSQSSLELLYMRAGAVLPAEDLDSPLEIVALKLADSPSIIAFYQYWSDIYPDGVPISSAIHYSWWQDQQRSRLAEMIRPRVHPKCEICLSIVLVANDHRIEDIDSSVQSILTSAPGGPVEIIVVCAQSYRDSLLIKLDYLAKNNQNIKIIANGYNSSLHEMRRIGLLSCRGRYVARIEPGDKLDADKAMQVEHLSDSVDIVMTDCDQILEDGTTANPHLGSQWDPDGVLAAAPGGLIIVKRELAGKVGGFGKFPDGAGDWDFLLRAAEQSSSTRIYHLSLVIRHHAKNDLLTVPPEIALEVVRAHLFRTGRALGTPIIDISNNFVRIAHPLPQKEPSVTIIIPSKDNIDLLNNCITSIFERTDYKNYRIVIVDNGSGREEISKYLKDLGERDSLSILRWNKPFNWGALNNFAVNMVPSDVIVLLNDDTQVINAGWLLELVTQAIRPEVGVVGALLRYRDNGVQHAGLVVGPSGRVHHLRRFARTSECAGDRQLCTVRTVSAVTGACLAIRSGVYREVGGIESKAMRVTWSDVDLCIKVRAAGYRVVWTPFSELYHLEQATRGSDETLWNLSRHKLEESVFRNRWRAVVENYDPHLSPYLHPANAIPSICPDVNPAVSYNFVSTQAGWESISDIRNLHSGGGIIEPKIYPWKFGRVLSKIYCWMVAPWRKNHLR